MSFVDFRDKGTEEIYVGLTEEAPEDVTVSFRYEPSLLDAYNSNNDTEYQLFPVSAVTIPGKVTIAKGGVRYREKARWCLKLPKLWKRGGGLTLYR